VYSFPKSPGAPSLADISEKTAAVQGSSVDAIEQPEGDEMKTVSVSSKEAAAALSIHLDGMSLLFGD